MVDPNLIATALSMKNPSGFPSFTKSQIADIAIKEDSFLGRRIQKAIDMGVTKEQAIKYYAFGTSNGQSEEPKKESFFDRLATSHAQRAENLRPAIQQAGGSPIGTPELALNVAGQGMGFVNDVAGQAMDSIPQPVKNLASNVQDIGFNTLMPGYSAIKPMLNMAGEKTMEGLQDFDKYLNRENPRLARGVESVGNIAMAVPQLMLAEQVGGAVKGAASAGIKRVFAPKPPEILRQELKSVTGKIVQGDIASVKEAETSLKLIDTKGVETYEDLGSVIRNKLKAIITEQDAILAKDTMKRPLGSFTRTVTEGSAKVKTNPVQTSLDNLKELYSSTGDPENYVRITDMINRAKTDGLTVSEVNGIAREYGAEFGQKAFSKTGEPLTSVNARLFENTRTAVKKAARDLLPDDASKILDSEMHSLIDTNRNIMKMQEKVAALKGRVETRGLFERSARLLGRGINAATFNGLRGFLQSFFPSNVGLKTLNSIQIEENLALNLRKFETLSKSLNKMSDTQAAAAINKFVTETYTGPQTINARQNIGQTVQGTPPESGMSAQSTTLPEQVPPVNLPKVNPVETPQLPEVARNSAKEPLKPLPEATPPVAGKGIPKELLSRITARKSTGGGFKLYFEGLANPISNIEYPSAATARSGARAEYMKFIEKTPDATMRDFFDYLSTIK